MERGSWEKNGRTDQRENEEEEIESGGMRSERKDSVMCMSGCIMASRHPTKANQHSQSLRTSSSITSTGGGYRCVQSVVCFLVS